MKRFLFLIIFLFFAASLSFASGSGEELFGEARKVCAQDGAAALARCVSLHKEAAALGWPPSMRALGDIYLHRDFFRENVGKYICWYDFAVRRLSVFYTRSSAARAQKDEALGWFILAVDKYGDPVSAYILGDIYSDGYSFAGLFEPDFEKAVNWYGKAAKGGYAPALYALGDMAFNGKGTRQDYSLAAQYFAAASAAGDADGAYMVGLVYYQGIGVEQNLDLALEQLNLASERGSAAASALLEKIRKEMK